MKKNDINESCTVFNLFELFYMIPNYSYSRFLVFVQALHFYFSVVISNSFNLIFETDFLLDSII